ncbi:MAG: anhydro-N-acetylmuramic acid kinase [Ginsengibacter sp.]
MRYKVIGVMSGSSLDGLDIAFVEFEENAGKWTFNLLNSTCDPYDINLSGRLKEAINLNALDYQLLDVEYGHYIGQKINAFIKNNNIDHQVNFIAVHGHTTFHLPHKKLTHQMGNGAAIAAVTGLPVVSDLRALDVALGGQGAPIVPVGEKLLFPDFNSFLNIGGIANISFRENDHFIAFDVCPANKVLNLIAGKVGKDYDKNGSLSAIGKANNELLKILNGQEFYTLTPPKSLANSFGSDVIFNIIESFQLTAEDALATYTEHIAIQIFNVFQFKTEPQQLFISGGGAFNTFLMERIKSLLAKQNIKVYLPSADIINYKEAIIMALIGTLRWREQFNVYSSVTGASQNSIGGALWLGTDA